MIEWWKMILSSINAAASMMIMIMKAITYWKWLIDEKKISNDNDERLLKKIVMKIWKHY